MSTPLRAVLFDLDGTLVDSLTTLRLAYHRFLARRGRTGSDEEFARWAGPPLAEVVAGLAREHAFDEPIETLLAAYLGEVEGHYRDAPLFPAVLPLLDTLEAWGIAAAVVTSAPASLARPLLDARGVRGRLQTVVCGDEVERGKPSGDGYREALRRLQVSPEHAIAVEDSRTGVRAARAAGLRCIGLADASRRMAMARAGATVAASDLGEAKGIIEALAQGPGRVRAAREVLVRRVGELPPLDEETARQVDALWDRARSERPTLFDGRLLVVVGLVDDGGRIRIDVAEAPYRHYYAQHRGVPLGLWPLGVSGAVLLDEATVGEARLVVGRRSSEVTQRPGTWELIPSGSVAGERVAADGTVDVAAQLLEELGEELDVDAAQVRELNLLGVIESIADSVIDVAFRVVLRSGEAALSGAIGAHREYDALALRVPGDLRAELVRDGDRRFVATVQPLLDLLEARDQSAAERPSGASGA